jgi:hypothetical protein
MLLTLALHVLSGLHGCDDARIRKKRKTRNLNICRHQNDSKDVAMQALSAASAAKFNITPIRWQHPSHVAIVPTESKGKTEGNDWDIACGNLKT